MAINNKNYPLSIEKIEQFKDTAAHEHAAIMATRIRDLCHSHEVLRERYQLYKEIVDGIAELIEKFTRGPTN